MTETYQASYEGGFEGMKPSDEAVLELSDAQFVLKRPRVFFSRGLHKIWAKWSAVTQLRVEANDGGGSRLELATKLRGSGTIVLDDVSPVALWEVLDAIADLKERFHDGDGVTSESMTSAGDEPADELDTEGSEEHDGGDSDNSGDAASSPNDKATNDESTTSEAIDAE